MTLQRHINISTTCISHLHHSYQASLPQPTPTHPYHPPPPQRTPNLELWNTLNPPWDNAKKMLECKADGLSTLPLPFEKFSLDPLFPPLRLDRNKCNYPETNTTWTALTLYRSIGICHCRDRMGMPQLVLNGLFFDICLGRDVGLPYGWNLVGVQYELWGGPNLTCDRRPALTRRRQ